MAWYSIEPKQEDMLKNMDFYHLIENIKAITGYRTRFFKSCFQKCNPKSSRIF